jgi:hypothetical protein
MFCTVCYVVSFLFVVLFKMVPQKFTCPSRSDDIGNLYINTKRYGFFANESKDSKYFESGRNRSFNAKQGTGEQSDRSNYRRKLGNNAIVVDTHHQLLFRGKDVVVVREYLHM